MATYDWFEIDIRDGREGRKLQDEGAENIRLARGMDSWTYHSETLFDGEPCIIALQLPPQDTK